ncbi:hypothetical protein [Streptomyces xanthophaeus]|uniref:hypothetical protein n=1 Tax=Streptomyces xanthophaeus TaxID=67385 RepID=UPI002647FE2C|nr:hypothetical protein [Streptomyces xanthophaeus]WKD32849.1 hypothetical protein KO717_13375 [Streptomyces xanthophaeus]
MITDPELGEEWKTETLEPAGSADRLAPRERATGGPGPRPWLWALGGAVVASAVWAGGLYALGDRAAEPEISYRASKNLCQDFKARALSGITGDMHTKKPVNLESDHPAVYAARCGLANAGKDGVASDFDVVAQVGLYKKTDPSAEFDAPDLRVLSYTGGVRTVAVPDLGERAVMTVGTGESWLILKVLDGGVVFTVEAGARTFAETNGRPATDVDAVQAAMIEDTRELMAALKK